MRLVCARQLHELHHFVLTIILLGVSQINKLSVGEIK